ncbi:MAG: hypothetical protein HUJ61_04485, partial [Bacilli bacterium]|nr:hypothetical protein [Bacilli bacterium]
MVDFTDYKAWGFLLLLGILLLAFLIAFTIKHTIPFMRKTLIPTSVLAGILVLLVSFIYTMAVGPDASGNYKNLFNTEQFGGNGLDALYYITFHCLALGFIASFFRNNKKEKKKGRFTEVLNTGVTTVSCYLLQGVLGLGITMIIALFVKDFFPAAGILLPFGFGQGTGQALNYGTIFERGGDGAYPPFKGGANFGLTIAALGFIASSIGGIIFLQHYKRKHPQIKSDELIDSEDEDTGNTIVKEAGGGKLSIQLGLILVAYAVGFGLMYVLGFTL